jgi:hypothetical protein
MAAVRQVYQWIPMLHKYQHCNEHYRQTPLCLLSKESKQNIFTFDNVKISCAKKTEKQGNPNGYLTGSNPNTF